MSLARSLFAAAFLGGAAVTVAAASLSVALVKREAASLPPTTAAADYQPAVTSKIYAADGTLIGRFAGQNRTVVPLSGIPPVVVQAFVSAEDRNFWRHGGIDPLAIARATVANMRNRGSGRRPVGASTITQQVVKNLLVGDDASLRRKVREALMALRIEKELGKNRVMELYLNEIYLGEAAYGVAAAADAYFGKPLAQLDVAEAAFLGGLPKGPSNYDPVKRPDAAMARRSYVISRMLDDGAITAGQAALAQAEPLPHPSARALGGVADGYFPEEARRDTVARFGASALYHKGLTVRTSMDPALQAAADRALRDGLAEYDRRHGWRGPLGSLPAGTSLSSAAAWTAALAAIEPPAGAEDWRMAAVLSGGRDLLIGLGDGTVGKLTVESVRWARAVRGNGLGAVPRRAEEVARPGDVILVQEAGEGAARHFELRQLPEVEGALVAIEASTGRVLAMSGGFSYERGTFNRATQSKRQPGSTFKPFIYLTAFGLGFDPTSPVLDSPVSLDVGPGLPRWQPGADGGSGWGLITARKALENSRNLATVRLLNDIGLDTVAGTARAFGIYDQIPNYAAALGALEVTDLQMAGAYAMLANGGYRIAPTLVDEVDGPDGVPLARAAPPVRDASTQVADPIAVAQLTSVLQGVVKHGTAAASLAKIDLPLAGKTGTTNDNVDAWFVGFSPDIAVGVHVGFDRPTPLGADEMGARAAAPIFGAFMQQALAIHPPSARSFQLPPGARIVTVDPVSGEPSKGGTAEVMRQIP